MEENIINIKKSFYFKTLLRCVKEYDKTFNYNKFNLFFNQIIKGDYYGYEPHMLKAKITSAFNGNVANIYIDKIIDNYISDICSIIKFILNDNNNSFDSELNINKEELKTMIKRQFLYKYVKDCFNIERYKFIKHIFKKCYNVNIN